MVQALESELAIRISTLLQQKVVLAIENNKLKQQMARLQQQKLIMDGNHFFPRAAFDDISVVIVNKHCYTSEFLEFVFYPNQKVSQVDDFAY